MYVILVLFKLVIFVSFIFFLNIKDLSEQTKALNLSVVKSTLLSELL